MQNEGWHLDKKVAIGTLLAVASLWLTVIGGFISITRAVTAWQTNTENRLENLEKTDTTRSTHDQRLTILEQKFEYIRGDLVEIKALLRRRVPDDSTDQP